MRPLRIYRRDTVAALYERRGGMRVLFQAHPSPQSSPHGRGEAEKIAESAPIPETNISKHTFIPILSPHDATGSAPFRDVSPLQGERESEGVLQARSLFTAEKDRRSHIANRSGCPTTKRSPLAAASAATTCSVTPKLNPFDVASFRAIMRDCVEKIIK